MQITLLLHKEWAGCDLYTEKKTDHQNQEYRHIPHYVSQESKLFIINC